MPRNYQRIIKRGRPRKPPKTREKMGRPPKYSPQLFARIVSLARLGWSIEAIAKLCDFNHETIYDWKEKFPDLSRDLLEARTYFDEKGSHALDFLMSKQKLKKRKIIKTIDENGKEITKTEISEEEIAPNASVVTNHVSRRAPYYTSSTGADAKSYFIQAFEQWTNNGAIDRYKEELPTRSFIGEAAEEPLPEPSEDQHLGRGSPFG